METYPVDLDAGQILRWVMAEQQTAPSTFRIIARRATEVREIPARKELHLGDEEREDLREIATVATLEIAPFHSHDGWRPFDSQFEHRPRRAGTGFPGCFYPGY